MRSGWLLPDEKNVGKRARMAITEGSKVSPIYPDQHPSTSLSEP